MLKRANDECARGVHPSLPRPTQQRLARRDAPLDERDVEQTEEPPEPQHRVDARRVVSQETVERAVAPPVDDPEIFAVRRDVVATDVVARLERSRLLAFPRAALNALRFRRLTSTSLRELLAEGLRMKRSSEMTWSQVAMAANAPMLTRASMVEGRAEVGILPTGQGVGTIAELPTCAELIDRTMVEAIVALDRVSGTTSEN